MTAATALPLLPPYGKPHVVMGVNDRPGRFPMLLPQSPRTENTSPVGRLLAEIVTS
jgi:hypothetical protein